MFTRRIFAASWIAVAALYLVACGGDGGGRTTVTVALPGQLGTLGATAGSNVVDIAWSASADGGTTTAYKVFRATTPSVSTGGTPLAARPARNLTYSDTSVSNGLTYYYRVVASNAAGQGPDSNEVSVTPPGWVALTPMPIGKTAHTAEYIAGNIYVVDGCTDSSCGQAASIDQHNIATNSWSLAATLGVSASDVPTAVVNGKILLLGGAIGGIVSTSVEEFDPISKTFTNCGSTCAVLPSGCCGQRAVGVSFNNRAYLFGGYYSEYSSQLFDPVANAWTTKSPPPLGIYGARAVTVDGIIYVLGGYISGPGWGNTNMLAYNPLNDTWTVKPSFTYPRWYHSIAAVGGRIFLFGGTSDLTPWSQFMPSASSP